MEQVTYTTIGENRGKVRLWIEGAKLSVAGFVKGAHYTAEPTAAGFRLVLDADGDRKVSGRSRNGRNIPIIDITANWLEEYFTKGERLRAVFSGGVIDISIHHEDAAKSDREDRIKTNVKAGKVQEGSMCTGGGVSTLAIHESAQQAGLAPNLCWVVDQELKYLQVGYKNNVAITDETVCFVGSLEEIEAALYSKIDVLSVSLPCAGLTKAGTAKHKQTSAEHISGTSIFGLVAGIKSANPAVVISENVVEGLGSDIYTLLASELTRTGYTVFHRIVTHEDTATFERRNRYWMVAISSGIADGFEFNFPDVLPSTVTLDDLKCADIPETMWCDNQYLKDKAITDAAAGKGFVRQLMTGVETYCGTIGRHYAKKRSTEPFFVRHDDKERLFTKNEHARVKNIPEVLVADVPTTTAHEILGQSIDYLQGFFVGSSVFTHLKKVIG
jgi:DNA (cytosine-5)-methyltransferase 1